MLHESISLPVAATLLLVVGLWWLLAGVVTHQSPYAEFHRCRPPTSLPSLPRILLTHQISRDIIYQILAQLEFYLRFKNYLSVTGSGQKPPSIFGGFLSHAYGSTRDSSSTNFHEHKPRKATEKTHKVKNIFVNTNLIITKDSRHQFKPHSKIQTPSCPSSKTFESRNVRCIHKMTHANQQKGKERGNKYLGYKPGT